MAAQLSTMLQVLIYSSCGAILTWVVVEKGVKAYVRRKARKKENKKEQSLSELSQLAFISGLVEIFLYCGSMLVGKPEFIVFWIGVKTALRWDRKPENEESKTAIQRGTYHTFLLGNALNIMFAYVSACLVTGQIISWAK